MLPFVYGTAQAQFFTIFSWNNPSGGSYNSTANWSGGDFPGIPNAADEGALFNLDPSAYTVDFPTNISTATATVRDGSVRWDLDPDSTGPRTYTLGTLTVDPGVGDTLLEVTNGTVDVAQLRVRNAGQLRTQTTLFQSAGAVDISNGTGTVTGPLASWTSDIDLELGRAGTGTLIVEQGGTVSHRDGFIGKDAGSMGTVSVRDDNSSWTLTDELHVGELGVGALEIEDGGDVGSVRAQIGFDSGSMGEVTVADDGSTFSTGSFQVGLRGEGFLTIQDGGHVTASSTRLGGAGSNSNSGPGSVSVSGIGAIFDSGFVAIGNRGDGTLNVSNGGEVSSTGADIGRLADSTNNPSSGEGRVVVSGNGATWTIDAGLSIGGGAIFNNGSPGTLTINAGGTVTVGESTLLHQNGRLDLQGGSFSTSSITIAGEFNPGLFVWTSGTLLIDEIEGDLAVPTGGTLSPGRTAGVTPITGDYVQQAGAALEIEVGGTSIAQHDFVDIDGSALLDGELHLKLIDDFTPAPSDTFTILSAADGIAGVFTNVATGGRLDSIDGLGSFQVHYGATSQFNPNQIVLTDFLANVLPGDYNEDGVVDAADYTVWRDSLGAPAGTLPNDIDGGVIGGDQYATWKSNFGATSSAAASLNGAPVPEPSTLLVVLSSLGCAILIAQRRASLQASTILTN